MTLPNGYVDSAQESDGVWCVTLRRRTGKHVWCFGKTIDGAMAEAIRVAGAARSAEGRS